VAFTTTFGKGPKKGKCKKKYITCYKYDKTGHYLNKCDEDNKEKESNKKGSNFLVMRQEGDESGDEGNGYTSSDQDSQDDDDNSDNKFQVFDFMQRNVLCSL